jgi:DNA polymerase-3 subunit alpha
MAGYQNLMKMATESHLKGFYYKPRIDKELLKKHSEGLIGMSACINGEVPRLFISGKDKEAEKAAREYEEIFGKGNFYLEIMEHPNLQGQDLANEKMIELSKKIGIPLIATNDVHYLNKEDAAEQDVLLCIQMNKKVGDKDRLTMLGEDYSLKSPKQMIEAFKDVPEAIENTQRIVEQCNLDFEFGKTLLILILNSEKRCSLILKFRIIKTLMNILRICARKDLKNDIIFNFQTYLPSRQTNLKLKQMRNMK